MKSADNTFDEHRLIAVMALDPHLFEPTDAHDLSQTGRVISIRFYRPHLQGRIGVARIDTQDRQSTCRQRIPEPNSKRTRLKANTR